MSYITKASLITASSEIAKADGLSASVMKIKEKIDEFVSTSKITLRGAGFDALRAKLTYYSEIYSLVSELCDIVSNNCISVNNSMSNYIEPYVFLNDAFVDSIKKKIAEITSELSELEEFTAQYNDLSYHMSDLQKKCEKLEGLKLQDNILYSKLAPTREEIKKLLNYVDNIPLSKVEE